MRNLRNIHRSLIRPPDGHKLTASTWDVRTDSIICAFGPTKDSTLLELKRWHKYTDSYSQIASWDAPPPNPDLEFDSIINLQHFSDIQTTCLVLAGGDLVLVREAPADGEDKIEIVGSVDVGISAAEWSPDEELLAITTKASTLLFMTRDFENVADVQMDVNDLKVSSHVDVGWGKKETQFKGKNTRALRDPTVPETVDEGALSGLDDGGTTITWRGDGAYLAINAVIEIEQKRRTIRVYSREGVLDSVSEPVNGLESALSWRPEGNLIAGVQRLDGFLKVVFFERNGLRHGQFDLRLSREETLTWGSRLSLRWSVDSSVLAVCFVDRVQLWTMGNYNYYLKQEIFSSSQKCNDSNLPASVNWHPERPLHVTLSSEGAMQRLAYASVVSHHPLDPPYDYGIIAVIDGAKLKLTPMKIANVPPPMAAHEIDLPENALDVTVSVQNDPEPELWICVMHRCLISNYYWPIKDLATQGPYHESSSSFSTATEDFLKVGLQVSAVSTTGFAVLQHDETASYGLLNYLSIKGSHFYDPAKARLSPYTEGIVSCGPGDAENILVIRGHDDKVHVKDVNGQHKSDALTNGFSSQIIEFPVSSARVEAVTWCSESRESTQDPSLDDVNAAKINLVFSLAENGSLYVNEQCLVKNCTSFLVTARHLIFTTSQHLLKFVHLGSDAEDLDVPPDTPEKDERCRSVERGAKLVTVMPSIFALVLQMPRGNLETIYPRALVVAGIRDSINKGKYKKAFLACRTQRVDMNILYDHAPQQFLNNIGKFIEQIKKPEHIDLFLSGLKEEDVTKTMYQETIKPDRDVDEALIATTQSSKVNSICDAFLDSLTVKSGHIQNIISAHVCKQPPDLDAGLSQISKLRRQKSDQVDTAVEHICFLADANRLFDNALGLYDLELTLLIAQQSQKDPREYLPFLQTLQNLPDLRRKFSIDDHIKRHPKALSSLCTLDAFDEVKAYTTKHALHPHALSHYRYSPSRLAALTSLYADHLSLTGSHASAAYAFESISDYPLASTSYRLAHLWRESLTCAILAASPPDDLTALAHTLATARIESHDYHSAALIHADHLHDIPTAASLYCKGHFYPDAHRLIALHHLPNLLTSVLDPGLVEGMATMTEMLAEMKAQLEAQVPRIRELREKQAQDPLAFYEGDPLDGANGDNIPDNVSLAPTDASTAGGNTLFTRYTSRSTGNSTLATDVSRRSSKNRRREERKRARGKKGSVYEEEYLVGSVRRLVERVEGCREEVGRLVVGLFRRGMTERARAVEGAMVEVVGIGRGCLGEVFGKEEKDVEGEEKKAQMPVLREFERLLVLGAEE